MSDEEISLTRENEAPPRSLAKMLTSQYVSKEFLSVLASTEIRETEIVGLSGVIGTRFVSLIMSTSDEDLIGLKGEQLQSLKERLAIKKRILRDPNAMAFVIQDAFLSGFVLARQSLKRQSRKEAMQISMSPRPMQGASDVGLKDKLFSKLGVSRKYQNMYAER